MRISFLMFLLIPLAEMWLLIEVGSVIGGLSTLGLVVLTAFIGVNLLRRQGVQTLQRFQAKAASGQLPGKEIIEGMMLAVAGVLLLTPGFLTDTIGFMLLVPGIRTWLFSLVGHRIGMMGQAGQSSFRAGGFQSGGFGQPPFDEEPAKQRVPQPSQHDQSHMSNRRSDKASGQASSHTLEGEFHEEPPADHDKP
ncbi:MAG: FxsA family protein [Pseudomonadales bacterium]|nr:FxsA family protein [Pseudomonadales bacterium]